MSRTILKIRAEDRLIFEHLVKGTKTVEVRAGSPKYQQVRAGDVFEFRCGDKKAVAEVVSAHHFGSIDAMLSKIPLKKIAPWEHSVERYKALVNSFQNYPERIKKAGLLAWEIKLVKKH